MNQPSRNVSLVDALDTRKLLPAVFQVASDCKLKGEIVLEKGQIITVLDRRYAELIFGSDWDGQYFRLSTNIVNNQLVDTIDEHYPQSVNDVISMVKLTDFIQVKTKFQDEYGNELKKYSKIRFCEFADANNVNVILELETKERIILNTFELFNKNQFVFVKVKETIQAQTLLRSFQRQIVHFHASENGTYLPLGNVELESIHMYDIVWTVSLKKHGFELLYETFPVDRRILVNLIDMAIPKHVEILGRYRSQYYQEKLTEVNFLMFYEIYVPRYYGLLKMENHLLENHLENSIEGDVTSPSSPSSPPIQRPASLDLSTSPLSSKSKAKEIFTSFRRSCRSFFKSSPIKESQSRTLETDVSPEKHSMLNKTQGVYKSLDNLDAGTPEEEKTLGSVMKLSESSPHLNLNDAPSENVTLQRNENALYGFDTATLDIINQLKEERNRMSPVSIRSKKLKNHEQERRWTTQPLQLSKLAEGKTFYNSAVNLTDTTPHRSPSLPVRMPRCERSDKPQRPASTDNHHQTPPLNAQGTPSSVDSACDSGIDTPDKEKGAEAIANSFASRHEEEREERGVEDWKCEEISKPFEFKHMISGNTFFETYAIPQRKSSGFMNREKGQSFVDLNNSNNFPDDFENNERAMRFGSSSPVHDDSRHNIEAPIYEDVIYAKVKGNNMAFINQSQKRELDSIREIKSLNVAQVLEMLRKLGLEKRVEAFDKELVNGAFLVQLSEDDLQRLNLTNFEALKLYKHIHGWRPNTNDTEDSRIENLQNLDHNKWSVNDVVLQMTSIRLPKFAEFCRENQIDGTLLYSLVRKNMSMELRCNGAVIFTDIECKRLEGYVYKKIQFTEEDLQK